VRDPDDHDFAIMGSGSGSGKMTRLGRPLKPRHAAGSRSIPPTIRISGSAERFWSIVVYDSVSRSEVKNAERSPPSTRAQDLPATLWFGRRVSRFATITRRGLRSYSPRRRTFFDRISKPGRYCLQ